MGPVVDVLPKPNLGTDKGICPKEENIVVIQIVEMDVDDIAPRYSQGRRGKRRRVLTRNDYRSPVARWSSACPRIWYLYYGNE